MKTTRAAECGTKHGHPDRDRALKHLAQLEKTGCSTRLMQAYRCRWCAPWHVGHQDQRKHPYWKRRRRRR